MRTQEEEFKISEKPSNWLSKPVFNSKLFIDLDINNETDELNTSAENNTEGSEGSDISFEKEEMNCLSNELIEELDNNAESPKERDNKINNIKKGNIIDSLLSLVNNGYEFKPKNFNPSFPKNPLLFGKIQNIKNSNKYINPIMNNKIYLFNPINSNIINGNNIRDKKKDWICSFCNNLNFSFRTKCNRCKIKKEDSERRKNILMNFPL